FRSFPAWGILEFELRPTGMAPPGTWICRRHPRRIRAAPPPSQKAFCLKTPALGVYDPWREILRRSLPHAPKEYPKLMAVTALVRRSGRAVQSSAFKRSEFSL